jgi:hypothetical protein
LFLVGIIVCLFGNYFFMSQGSENRKSKVQTKITDSFMNATNTKENDTLLKIKIPRNALKLDAPKFIAQDIDAESMIVKMIETGGKKHWSSSELKQVHQEVTQQQKEAKDVHASLNRELIKLEEWRTAREKQITQQKEQFAQMEKEKELQRQQEFLQQQSIQSPAPLMATASPGVVISPVSSPIPTPFMMTPLNTDESQRSKHDFFMNPTTPLSSSFDTLVPPSPSLKRKFSAIDEPTSPEVNSPENPTSLVLDQNGK